MSKSLRAGTVISPPASTFDLGLGDHLDLEVGAVTLSFAPCALEQHVAQDRQGLPSLHDADDGLQRLQEGFPRCAELHYCLYLSIYVCCSY